MRIPFLLVLLTIMGSNKAQSQSPTYPLAYSKGDKYGYVDKDRNIVIPLIYDNAAEFQEGLAWVYIQGKFAYIDPQGKIVIPWFSASFAGGFFDGYAMIGKKEKPNGVDKYGYINHQGKIVVPPVYDKGKTFSNGLVYVEKGKERLYVDTSGKVKITLSPDQEYASDCTDGYVLFKQNELLGYFDNNGKIAITPRFKLATQFFDGAAKIYDGNNWGLINKKADTIAPLMFDFIYQYPGNLIAVSIRDKAGFLNHNGKVAVPMIFTRTGGSVNSLGIGEKDGESYTVYQENNMYKVKLVYQNRYDAVPAEGSNTAVNKQPDYFIPPSTYFTDEPPMAMVVKNGRVGFINKERKLVIPFDYDLALPFSYGRAAVFNGKKWGFIDKDNKLVIGFLYDKVLNFVAGISKVWIGNKEYYIKTDGQEVQ